MLKINLYLRAFNATLFSLVFLDYSNVLAWISTGSVKRSPNRAFSVLFSVTSSKGADNLPDLFPSFSQSIKKLGFSYPTPIQAVSAARSADENLLLIAPTGSGKTLAYLLPALEKALSLGGTVVVVAPTRELSVQLNYVASRLLEGLSDIGNDDGNQNSDMKVLLAVKGVDIPTPEQLNLATVLVGTPSELYLVLTKIQGGLEFIAGDVLTTVILDEVDILLPSLPKELRTALDKTDKGKSRTNNSPLGNIRKISNTVQDERRKQEQKRKLNAVQRGGLQMSSDNNQVVGPTDRLLNLIATRSASGRDIFPCQVLAGSATASRKTLDRLNKALYNAACDAASTVDAVWAGNVKFCRPDNATVEENSIENNLQGNGSDHTIRAVTVPREVKHQYVSLSKESASLPSAAIEAVAKAVSILKPQTALLFLCGEFSKSELKQKVEVSKNINVPSERVKKTLEAKRKKTAASKDKKAEDTTLTFSARQACSALAKYGIEAIPLHVALGLEIHSKGDNEDVNIPPFLVTFEGSARGLHVDDVDVVFLLGRPASAASYLHLAGRVGRSVAHAGGVTIRPGTVVSLCTTGSAKELAKWTKQIGGTELQELLL